MDNNIIGTSIQSLKLLKLVAPLSGNVCTLDQVPDPVFSKKLAGDGIAIIPQSQSRQLVSPANAMVKRLFHTHHAIGLVTTEGIEILLHIGIETIKMNGRGFFPLVKEGDRIKAGDPLINFQADELLKEVSSLMTPMLITNMQKVAGLHIETRGPVTAGLDTIVTLKLK